MFLSFYAFKVFRMANVHLYNAILFAGCPYIMSNKILGHPVAKIFFCIKLFLNTSQEKSFFFRGQFKQKVVENLNILIVREDLPSPVQNRVNLIITNLSQHPSKCCSEWVLVSCACWYLLTITIVEYDIRGNINAVTKLLSSDTKYSVVYCWWNVLSCF